MSPLTTAPSTSETPGSASTARRRTHSKVMRRRDGHQVVVARHRLVLGHAGGQLGSEAQLGRSGRVERVEDVGRPFAEQVAGAGEECVGVAHLRRPAATPLVEGVIGALRHLAVVAFEDRDLVAVAAQCER